MPGAGSKDMHTIHEPIPGYRSSGIPIIRREDDRSRIGDLGGRPCGQGGRDCGGFSGRARVIGHFFYLTGGSTELFTLQNIVSGSNIVGSGRRACGFYR